MPNNKVVVITGASSGIGRALAHRFAREGANIALLARGAEKLAATAEEVNRLGGQALTLEIDVLDPDAVEAAATRIEQQLGPIDIWINNAAVILYGNVLELSPEEIQRVTDVNYHGAVWGTKAALSRMRARGRGTIVQVGSGAAYRGVPWMSAYSAAKFALRGFTEALRAELRHDGVNVRLISVHPSSINTPLYTWARNHLPRQVKPLPPIYEPELAAEVIHRAAYSNRVEVLFGWSALGAAMSHRLPPRLVDRVLARVAYKGQQTSQPVAADHEDNLFEPVEVDYGIRGQFSERSLDRAPLAKLLARLGAGGLRAISLGLTALAILGDDDD